MNEINIKNAVQVFRSRSERIILTVKIFSIMNRNLHKRSQVSVCYDKSCVHAFGSNADMIANAVTTLLLLIGIAAFIRVVAK